MIVTESDRGAAVCVVLGSGGHARAAIEVLRQCEAVEICGCTAPEGVGETVAGIPVLGGDSVLASLRETGVTAGFVAIGDNRLRRRLGDEVLALGLQLFTAVSVSAYVAPDVKLGRGVIVMPGVVIRTGAVIGDGVIVNSGAVVDHDALIGAWAHVGPGANLAGNVTLGEGAFLGAGCNVIPDVAVGAWTVVGAGAVVIRSLPENVMAVGSPARVIRNLG